MSRADALVLVLRLEWRNVHRVIKFILFRLSRYFFYASRRSRSSPSFDASIVVLDEWEILEHRIRLSTTHAQFLSEFPFVRSQFLVQCIATRGGQRKSGKQEN